MTILTCSSRSASPLRIMTILDRTAVVSRRVVSSSLARSRRFDLVPPLSSSHQLPISAINWAVSISAGTVVTLAQSTHSETLSRLFRRHITNRNPASRVRKLQRISSTYISIPSSHHRCTTRHVPACSCPVCSSTHSACPVYNHLDFYGASSSVIEPFNPNKS